MIALPLKRQWQAILGHEDDAGFTATYGPLLAKKRTQFLDTAHPAWDVFGKWLQSWEKNYTAWFEVVRNVMESGIFFSSDFMAEVVVPSFEGAVGWSECLIKDPTIFWLLHVRPHLSMIQTSLLRRFAARSFGLHKMLAGEALEALTHYMTREEQDTYTMCLLMMMEKLDYHSAKVNNVALNVMYELRRIPKDCAARLIVYVFDKTISTARQRLLCIDVLIGCLSGEELNSLLTGKKDKQFYRFFRGQTDDTDDIIDDTDHMTCQSLLNLLLKAKRSVDISTLMRISPHVYGWLKEQGCCDGDDSDCPCSTFSDSFSRFCEMCVEPQDVERIINYGEEYDSIEVETSDSDSDSE